MDDDGGLGIRNWVYYDHHPQIKGNLGLQLMSNSTQTDTKPLLSTNATSSFLHRVHHEPTHAPIQMNFARSDMWVPMHQNSPNKLLHSISMATHNTHHHPNFSLISENTLPAILQHHPTPSQNDQIAPLIQDPNPSIPTPMKKRAQAHSHGTKSPKPKKPKKAPAQPTNCAPPRGAKQVAKKDTGMIINGIDLDLSKIPTPVCSCTGSAQQCYRWGVGGWQSACCTTSISIHPLPMSEKRRGARIAGRKMSQGAFKKVLEKLAGEGYNLANPIDLRGFWAKHGTNKFVTIK